MWNFEFYWVPYDFLFWTSHRVSCSQKKTTVILFYLKHPIKRKYFRVKNMKAILVVMNTTELVVKIRPEKKFKPVRDLNPWSPMTSHDLWVQISYGPEFFFSVLIFTTSSVVFISARIAFIFVSSIAVHIYMIFMYLQSFIIYSLWSKLSITHFYFTWQILTKYIT